MRILLPMHGFITWNGGVDLMRVISASLRAVRIEQGLDLVYAFPHEWPGQSAASLQLRAMVRDYALDGAVVDCDEDGRGINLAAIESNADVIFPTMWPIRTRHVPKVGYLYDFQHRELPHLFPPEERARRDAEFAEIAQRSDALFSTSRHVASGMTKYLGVPPERVVVMPYTPYVQDAWFAENPHAVRAKYRIGGNYLLISNHFWVHKDHGTAIRAFAEVVADPAHTDLELVMTGDVTDSRDPEHFTKLQALMQDLGVVSRCHVLGFIPKADQLALLRGARAMIQPTLFEGGPGGGASYEAVGFGVPLALSDIDVNREVVGSDVHLYAAGDARALANAVRAILLRSPALIDRAACEVRASTCLKTTGTTLSRFVRDLVQKR